MSGFRQYTEGMSPVIDRSAIVPVAERVFSEARKIAYRVLFSHRMAGPKPQLAPCGEVAVVSHGGKTLSVPIYAWGVPLKHIHPATNPYGNDKFCVSAQHSRFRSRDDETASAITITVTMTQEMACGTKPNPEVVEAICSSITHELGHAQRDIKGGRDGYEKIKKQAGATWPGSAARNSYYLHPYEVEANMAAILSYYRSLPEPRRLTLAQLLAGAVNPEEARAYLSSPQRRRRLLARLAREGIVTAEMGANPR